MRYPHSQLIMWPRTSSRCLTMICSTMRSSQVRSRLTSLLSSSLRSQGSHRARIVVSSLTKRRWEHARRPLHPPKFPIAISSASQLSRKPTVESNLGETRFLQARRSSPYCLSLSCKTTLMMTRVPWSKTPTPTFSFSTRMLRCSKFIKPST